MFYKCDESEQISVSGGCLEKPINLVPSYHIYVTDASDYYEITDDLPTFKEDVEQTSAYYSENKFLAKIVISIRNSIIS